VFTQAQIEAITIAFREALYNIAGQFPPSVQEPDRAPPPPPPPPVVVDPRVAEIARLEAQIAALKPATPAPLPGVTYSAGPNGFRVDDPATPGTPGTRTCPVTGHVLSDPIQPGTGEGFAGYVMRVYRQAGGNETQRNAAGAMVMTGPGPLFEKFGGYTTDGSNWHLAADLFYNPKVYATPAELLAEANRQAAWDRYGQRVQERVAAEHGSGGPPAGYIPGSSAGAPREEEVTISS
jgi:hypothetical protein